MQTAKKSEKVVNSQTKAEKSIFNVVNENYSGGRNEYTHGLHKLFQKSKQTQFAKNKSPMNHDSANITSALIMKKTGIYKK